MDDVGFELLREQGTSALRTGEQHAARRPGQLREEALLGRDAGHEIGAAERLRRRLPDRSDARERAPLAAQELPRAVRARHDHPVVPLDFDGLVADRLDLDQRHVNDVVAEQREPLDQLTLLSGGPRDDDARQGQGSPTHSPPTHPRGRKR